MQITKAKFGDQAKVKYADRFKARGGDKTPSGRTRVSDVQSYMRRISTTHVTDHAYGSKPEHEKRFADITDCFPLLKVGH